MTRGPLSLNALLLVLPGLAYAEQPDSTLRRMYEEARDQSYGDKPTPAHLEWDAVEVHLRGLAELPWKAHWRRTDSSHRPGWTLHVGEEEGRGGYWWGGKGAAISFDPPSDEVEIVRGKNPTGPVSTQKIGEGYTRTSREQVVGKRTLPALRARGVSVQLGDPVVKHVLHNKSSGKTRVWYEKAPRPR